MGILFLVRHAAAGARGSAAGHDHDRPLIDKGWSQARHAGEVLKAFAPVEVRSSPLTRCMETASAIAEACGLEVIADKRLAEGHWLDLPLTPETIVWVAHGDNIPELLHRCGVDCHSCQKGSVWRLSISDHDGTLESAEYLGRGETS